MTILKSSESSQFSVQQNIPWTTKFLKVCPGLEVRGRGGGGGGPLVGVNTGVFSRPEGLKWVMNMLIG